MTTLKAKEMNFVFGGVEEDPVTPPPTEPPPDSDDSRPLPKFIPGKSLKDAVK